MSFVNIFSQSVAYPLIFLFCLHSWEVLHFNKVQVISDFFNDVCFGGHHYAYGHLGFSPVLSSKGFIVFHFTFRSEIHFELHFCEVFKVCVKIHFCACQCPFVPAPFLERPSFLHCITYAFFQSKISWLYLCESFSGLSILFYWSICLFVHQYQPSCIGYCNFIVGLKVRWL